jgi:hypothetical protein
MTRTTKPPRYNPQPYVTTDIRETSGYTLADKGLLLHDIALRADAQYSEVITRLTGKTRWTMAPEQNRIPAILNAYRAKVASDTAWLAFLQENR